MADSGSTGGGTPVTLVVLPTTSAPSPISTPIAVVTNPRPHLPFTGFDFTTALVVITLLLAVGVLLLVTGRRPTPKARRI
ncbi:MAG: hypothetical protein JWM02_1018 [Frankiales bacterium]|nr:hypothetical protein [Frankiales bacterium]